MIFGFSHYTRIFGIFATLNVCDAMYLWSQFYALYLCDAMSLWSHYMLMGNALWGFQMHVFANCLPLTFIYVDFCSLRQE